MVRGGGREARRPDAGAEEMESSAPNSPGARSRQDLGANLVQELEALSLALSKATQASNVVGPGPSPRKESGSSLQRRETMPARAVSDMLSKLPPAVGNASQGANRKPPHHRHSLSGRPSVSLYGEHEKDPTFKQPRQARHSIAEHRPQVRLFEPHEEETPKAPTERKIQPWHSQGYEKNLPEVTNFPEWLEDNINFSRKLEAPADKKKSIWNWKPFRTLSHIGHTRYNCLFTVHVHAIEGLPAATNGLRLTVNWRHKDREVQTMPARVFHCSAEFEETLQLRCSVYGSKSAHHAVKFMPKAFALCVIAPDLDDLVVGQHNLDLSRLLPEVPDHEHEDDDKPLSWTTSFKLSGKAKGGTLVVTFGYELLQREKGERSGRFGSVVGSPSPSMTSPSLRSSSGSYSTHGTPRPRPSDGNNFLSPTLSEPGDYHDYMGMEHLNLDESPTSESSFGSRSSLRDNSREVRRAKEFPYEDSKIKGWGLLQAESTLAPSTPRKSEVPAEPTKASWLDLPSDPPGESDEEQEFVVVDQGVEVGTLPEDIQYANHIYDEERVKHERLERKETTRVSEEKLDVGGHDEEETYEDAVDDIKVWDPIGRLLGETGKGAQDAKLWERPARHQKEDQYEEEMREPKFWDRSGPHREYRSEEAAPETVFWEAMSAREEITEGEHGEIQRSEDRLGQFSDADESNEHKPTLTDGLDDEVDLIAGDFLSMLEGSEKGGIMGMSSDSENDSPRALLLRQFEHEALLEGGIGLRLGNPGIAELDLDAMAEAIGNVDELGFSGDGSTTGWQSEEDPELASIMEAAESELQKATQTMRSKTRAKMLEDAETEALMQEWGLNETAFENSPPKPAQGFLDMMGNDMVKVPTEPPVLAQGVGPVLQTKDGGMLRSMSPALFSQSNASGKLVMQVSKPVVVPSEMGSSGLDVFRRLASAGVENMALQAMVAMPLEDITGKSVHQIAYESKTALEGQTEGQKYLPSNGYSTALSISDTGRHRNDHEGLSSRSRSSGVGRRSGPSDPSDEFVSLEELAPMAMQKIEALAMDGLKIQSDMTDEVAPYSVDSLPWADAGARENSKRGIGSLDGVAAMHLDARGLGEVVPHEAGGLMSKVISIDEWMRLDAGQYDENDTKEDTLAILAAHGAVNKDVIARGSKEDRIRYLQGAKASANFGKGGFMGNTLTIAMLVQLRDPLRNNEPVGAPMMALVQAERVIVPPRPKIPRRAPSLLGNSEVWDEEEESCLPEKPEEPQFKITAVHMSGLKPSEEPVKEPINKKKTWGNQKQQQSGSRWLAANGMGKSSTAGSRLSALRNKPQPAQTTVKPGESLWSISARVHGTGSKWKEVAALNPHIRNPDVIFTNQKIRTR